MAPPRGVCRFFLTKNGCRYGDGCKFAHSSGTKVAGATKASSESSSYERTNTDLRGWRRRVLAAGPFGNYNSSIDEILREGKKLMDSGSADMLHEVIKTIASEEGLRLIRLVTDIEPARLTSVAYPFFQILSYQEAISSLVLEQHVATIYNVLFGISGRNGEKFFKKVLDYLSGLKNSSVDSISFDQLYASALSVFTRMVAINQSAAISEGIKSLSYSFEDCGSEILLGSQPRNFAALSATQSMLELRTRLGLSQGISEVEKNLDSITTGLAQFHILKDLPGNLCSTGARHDNDAADISSIKILPTAEEILSPVSEYLPGKDTKMHHLRGVPGLLDRQFRLLREDTVGQLRDAVGQICIKQEDKKTGFLKSPGGSQNLRTNIFRSAIVTGSFFDKRLGLLNVIEFEQPGKMRVLNEKSRKQAWKESRDLAVDACVCLVDSNNQVVFYSVVERDPNGSNLDEHSNNTKLDKSSLGDTLTNLHEDKHRAAIIVRAIDLTPETIAQTLKRQAKWSKTGALQTLLEFPGVLLASFSFTLQALQEMNKIVDLPFSDLLAPDSLGRNSFENEAPPRYARRQGFEFDLSKVAESSNIRLSPNRAFDINNFSAASGLDKSQAEAFVHALSNQFALIQGPPGTGKSFVGIQLIRTLLQSQKAAKLGPILCVCYTNHALDQILEHLAHNGVEQIVRIGGRSKSPLLENVNLAKLTGTIDKTKHERYIAWEAHIELERILKRALIQLKILETAGSINSFRRYLLIKHSNFYTVLFDETEDEDGFRKVKNGSGKVFTDWLKGGSREIRGATPSISRATDLYQLSHGERQALYKVWLQDMEDSAIEEVKELCKSYRKERQRLDICYKETSLRCLRQARIVGVTTTGLAKNIGLLRKLQSKVLVVEEAGEIMEAHMLPALLPSLEHVISIGDHRQLRPQIANFDLSVENPRGSQFSLDVSLFERLIKPEPGLPSLPCATLQTQRRMHPLISRLIRDTIYPKLIDGESVLKYPTIKSLRHRLFWFSHQELEDSEESMSKSNTFEVEMTAAVTHHIIKQGYKADQITILTPYLAQLRKLRRRFANVFEITVSERDEADLVTAGMDNEAESEKKAPKARRVSLSTKLRISTVDNYQGEESDIIIISLVRSNKEGKIGFLRTENRINVLLSRARQGMYILGNAFLAQGASMWKKVIGILEEENAIGPALPLFCERHPETDIKITCPDDFSRLAPEGGCNRSCNKRLACGHSCLNKCHATHLHDAVVCQNPCPRIKKTCSHPCPKVCGVECHEKCQAKVKDVHLPCGHVATQLKCFQSQAIEDVRCQQKVQRKVPRCGHVVEVSCYQEVTEDFRCTALCGVALPCGHQCSRMCFECNIVDEQSQTRIRHPECRKRCDRDYTTCSHRCQQACHGDQPCKPCSQPCQVQCEHSKCDKLCSEPCAPCAEKCNWSCEHSGVCTLPCSVPCNRLPCKERCPKKLSCEHQCPSICGETCPPKEFCQICGEEDILETVVDMIMLESYRETDLASDPVIVPPCGHMQTVSTFDGMMDMKKFYEYDENDKIVDLKCSSDPFEASAVKNCSTCRGPLRTVNRYARIVKRGLIDEATKRFIVWANTRFAKFEKKNHHIQSHLSTTVSDAEFQTNLGTKFDSDAVSTLSSIELKGSSADIISQIQKLTETKDRYKDTYQFRRNLKEFCKKLATEEQPFQRVWDLCRSSKDTEISAKAMADLESAADGVLNTRSHLLASSMLFQTDVAVLTDFIEIWQRSRAGNPTIRALTVDTSKSREQCIKLFDDSISRSQPLQQIEALVYFALFSAAEIRCPCDSEKTEELRTSAFSRLEEASNTLEKFPSTAALRSSVDSARKALGGVFQSVVTDAEMRAVYAAMATEFSGTGHWYYCENRHPFTIGECGMAMEQERCPQCGAPVGGRNHISVEGVTAADDIERNFGRNA